MWLTTSRSQLEIAPKLRKPFEGPFLVVRRLDSLLYEIQFNREGVRQVVHHNRLKPYGGANTLPWAKAAVKKLKKH